MECARDHNIIVARVDETGLITVGTDYIRPVITSEGIAKLRIYVPSSWESTEEVTVTGMWVAFTTADSSVTKEYEWDGESDVAVPSDVIVSPGFRFGARCTKSDGSTLQTLYMQDVIPCVTAGPSYLDDDELVDLLTLEKRLYESLLAKIENGVFKLVEGTTGEKLLIALTSGDGYEQPETSADLYGIVSDDRKRYNFVDMDARSELSVHDSQITGLSQRPTIYYGTTGPEDYVNQHGIERIADGTIYVKVVS